MEMKFARRAAQRRACASCASRTTTRSPRRLRFWKNRKSPKKRSRDFRRGQNKMVRMDDSREPLQPIFTAHLFPKLECELIALLRSLAPEDWKKQTLAPKWKVKDVAAHLLDTQTRGLAAAHRGYKPENSKKLPPDKLLTLINTLNAEGVRV